MKLPLLPMFVASLLFAGAANAATSTIDFGAFANGGTLTINSELDGSGTSSTLTGDEGYTSDILGSNAIDAGNGVLFRLGTTSRTGESVYFDEFSGEKPGGLGACSTFPCFGSSDDNLAKGEGTIDFMFNRPTNVTGWAFRNDDHNTFSGKVKINGVMVDILDGSLTAKGMVRLSKRVEPTSEWSVQNFAKSGLYTESFTVAPVPLPAAAWLLIGGLAAMGGLKARRNARA